MRNIFFVFMLCFSANAQDTFTVYFDFDADSATLSSINDLKNWIDNNPNAQIQRVYGYADKTGDASYNQDLSERRATFVYEQLSNSGLDTSKIDERGFGESQSIKTYNAPDRKVVIEYQKSNLTTLVPPPQPSELKKQLDNAVKGDKVAVKGMNFFNNLDVMLPSSRPVLQELLQILKDRPTLKIEIQGHVCCEPEKANISLKRAMAVYNYLVTNGIRKERLSYKAFGNSRPIYPIPEKNEEQKVANRRVEIEILEQ